MRNLIRIFIYPMIAILLVAIVGFIFSAGIKAYKGIVCFFNGNAFSSHSSAGLYFLKATDLVLGSIVVIILLVGIISLFDILPKSKLDKLPEWIHITNFKHLKILLWETVLLAMVILFFVQISKEGISYSYELLILPTATMLLSIGVYFVKKKD